MKFTNKILCVLAVLALVPAIALSDDAPPTQQEVAPIVVTLSPVEYADKYATQYGIDASVFKKVMWCESSNNPNAVGDGGKARNVMQFHKPTFDSYSNGENNPKRLGKDMDYNSYQDQIELGAYMFSIGQQSHWTCYKKVTGK